MFKFMKNWFSCKQENISYDIQKINYKAGDVFILTIKDVINMDQYERIKQNWRAAFPGITLLIISDRFKLSILSKDDVNANS